MELAKAYDPTLVEDRRYSEWLRAQRFRGIPGAGEPYCITIPPPNVTGSLHIGHALNNSVIDALIRWHRMLGHNVVCIPGTDHAGIATQNVVEREIAKDGLTRHDLGRDRFIERCWDWRRQYGDRINLQFQKLGCSYDWERSRFTMDDSYVAAIYEEFLRWWDRGLIYRGARVVNWCPRCRSAISDIEVNTDDRQGKLYHLRYPYADGSGWIVVATTRPETMLGDTAVAVNPDDNRYRDRVGATVMLPLADRPIPIIADEYAKMEFGSGAVKVTPAHDLDDFEAGLRHHLPQIKVIGDDGCMSMEAGPTYAGLDRDECRTKVLADLAERGLLERTEDYAIKTPLCDRCKTVLEPLLSEQWFAKQSELAEPAINAVKDGRVRFHPDRYARVYLDWMERIRDWCISRQLWWGHRIPVWWTKDGDYTAARTLSDASAKLGVPADELRQDEDVLDTWFSSALWPHAVLGWPEMSADLTHWYPTALLSTAQEIIYLWVARMIMTGLDFLGEVPFHDVYIHATVLDAKGERMSKSKGNGVDPIEVIDRYGADALRFSLLQSAGMNQDIRFSDERAKHGGAFCNKLWNASRFVLTNLADWRAPACGTEAALIGCQADLRTPDRWILSRLADTTSAVNAGMATYKMDDSMRAIYAFVWDEFCDWYLEAAKPRMKDEGPDSNTVRTVLAHVLDSILRLLHPMTPFITEELWQALRHQCGVGETDTIMTAAYPRNLDIWLSPSHEEAMREIMEVVRTTRNLRAELGVPPGGRLGAICEVNSVCLEDNADTLCALARFSSLTFGKRDADLPGTWACAPLLGGELSIELGGAIDVARERERLAKEISAVDAEIAKSHGKLDNPSFTQRAPEAIVSKERANLAGHQEKRERLLARALLFGM